MLTGEMCQFPRVSSPTQHLLVGACSNSIRPSCAAPAKPLRRYSPAIQPGGDHLVGLQKAENSCLKRPCAYVLQGIEGIKEKERWVQRGKGWEQRGTRKDREEEKAGDTRRYSGLFCCQRSSSGIQEICCHESSIHLHPQWALRNWAAPLEAGKHLPSPEWQRLRKQLCFSVKQSSTSRWT